MSYEKMKLTPDQVETLATAYSDQPIVDVVPLSGGEWSQAFAFRQGGKELVVRFGVHEDDFLKDRFAGQFGRPELPVPKVLEIGEAFGAHYAISERAFGTMLDDLDKAAMRRIIPSLFATMDAIRETDISKTTGYGMWDRSCNGQHKTWRECLLDISNDEVYAKIVGWKAHLKDAPGGEKQFNEIYEKLVELSKDLPEVRCLIHNDLLNFNVMVNDNKITAVFDWANAFYGDFLYDLAMFTFWGPIHKPVQGIDWEAEAKAHYEAIGLDIPEFKRRLDCCMLHIGLGALAYFCYKPYWEWYEPTTKRLLEIIKNQ
jgi:hygromycin-B 4-O-kinase